MANQLSEEKDRIVYAEWIVVRKELDRIAKREGISEAELLRRITLEAANKERRKQGKKGLTLDPSSGPFSGGSKRSALA